MRDDRRCVFFDFDGVIADTFSAAFFTASVECKHITEEKYRAKFEGNIYNSSHEDGLVHDKCAHDIDWWEVFYPKFQLAHPFPGSIRAVQDLAENYRLAIISSNISSPVVEFLKRFDAAHYFEDVLGGDVHRSKIEKVNMLFARYELAPEHCVFVTDTLGDMREAEKAGVASIGVSWGFHDRARLEKGNPFKIVDHPHELPGAVDAYFAG